MTSPKLIIGVVLLSGLFGNGGKAEAQGIVNPLTGSVFNSQPTPVQGYSQPPSRQYLSVQNQIGTPNSFHSGQFGGFANVRGGGGNSPTGPTTYGGSTGGNSNRYQQNGYGSYYGGDSYIYLPYGTNSNVVVGGDAGSSYGVTGYTSDGYPIYGYTAPGASITTFPSIYGYPGLPPYVTYAPSAVTIYNNPPTFAYVGGYVPYADPSVQAQPVYNVYNQYNTYNSYSNAPQSAPSTNSTSPTATTPTSATPTAAPTLPGTSSSDETILATAFKDISRAWLRSDITLISKYTDTNTKIAVLAKSQYQYSIAPDKFATTTDSVFDQLFTRSFEFDTLRAMTNGDVTAYAKQVYGLRTGSDSALKTMYVSYTLGKRSGKWLIVAVDSSPSPLAPTEASAATANGSVVTVTNGGAGSSGVTYSNASP